MSDEDDYYNSGNLDEAPGIGHNEGPEMDPEAVEERRRRIAELLLMDEATLLARARKHMAVTLTLMMEDGTAMPADMANLRQLLKDNGMIMGDVLKGDPGATGPQQGKPAPLPDLPTFSDPEYD